jgi:hypothetical protein
MTNDKSSNSKAFAIKSIMGNKKLASILFDSWNAPVGSTKNTKAKNIMKSIERSANNFAMDGKGGAGFSSNLINPFAKSISKPTINLGTATKKNLPTTSQVLKNSVSNKPIQQTEPLPIEAEQTKIPNGYIFLKSADSLRPPNQGTNGSSNADITQGTSQSGILDMETPYATSNYIEKLNEYGVDTTQEPLSESSRYVQEAVDTGIGSKTFTQQLFQNKPALAETIGVPIEALDFLPESGFLSDYLSDLKKATKDNYQLDLQLKKIEDLENSSVNIEGNLANYIKGKDEYLGQLDKIYNDAQTKMISMDLSDPTDAKRMNNYMNYLTILKGKQNQRYIDYIKTSVDTLQDRLDAANNTYKYTKEAFESDYEEAKSGATEKYNRLQDIVGEMYNNVSNREEDYYKKIKRQTDAIVDSENLAEIILENEQKRKELENPTLNPKFTTLIESEKDELEAGRLWGTAWNDIKNKFPTLTNEQIDNALGGGIVDTEEEAKAKSVNPDYDPPVQRVDGKWAWGWARPGAYQNSKQKEKTPDKQQIISGISELMDQSKDIVDEFGNSGWKGLTNKEICSNIRAFNIDPKDISDQWGLICSSVIPLPTEE